MCSEITYIRHYLSMPSEQTIKTILYIKEGALYLWRKSPKKVAENGKREKNLRETGNRSVPENDIFESRKTGKVENICGKRKTVFENCGNRKAVLKSCGKPEKHPKTMKSGGKPENRKKKLRKARKA